MNANQVADLYKNLRKNDPQMFFQCTRSSDRRVIKCVAMLNKDGKIARKVAKLVEYNLETKKDIQADIEDDIIDHFFSFSDLMQSPDPQEQGEGVYYTTCKCLPNRILTVKHIPSQGKFFMETTIDKLTNTGILGVHVTMDTPKNAAPLLRGITIYGYNKGQQRIVQENLPTASYMTEFAKLMMTK